MTSVLFDFFDEIQKPVTAILDGKIKQDNIYEVIFDNLFTQETLAHLSEEQLDKMLLIYENPNAWERVKQAHKIYLSNKYNIEPVNMDDEVQEDSKDSAFDREAFTISNDSRYSTRTKLLLSTLNSGKLNSLGLNSPAQFREVYTVVSRIGVGKYGLGKQSFETIIDELNKVDRPWAKQLINRLHFEPEERIDKGEQIILKANFLGDLDRAYITQWYYDYDAGTIVNMHRVTIANGMINDFKIGLQNLAKGDNILTIEGPRSFITSILNNAVNEEFKSFTYDVFLNARKGVMVDTKNKTVTIKINEFIEDVAVRNVFLEHINKHPELLKSDNVISRFDGKLAYAISLRTVAHDIFQQINEGVYVPNAYSEGSGLIELAKTKPINISILIGIKGVEDVEAKRLIEEERLAVDIMAYKKQGMLLTPTHSDKSTNYFITALSGEINKFGIYMEDLFKTELKVWYNNLGGKNKNNLIFYNEYFSKSELEAIRVRLDNGESIDTIYNEEIKGIEEYYNEFYEEELDRVRSKIKNINLPIDNKYDIEDYVRATIIQNMDLFRIVYGDPRYFKNVRDINKRIPYIFSTKIFMVDDKEIRKELKGIDGELFNLLDREDEKYKDSLDDFNKTTQLIIKSEVGASSNIDSIKQSMNLLKEEGIIEEDEVSALYEEGIDKTDAVAFITLDEFRELKWRAQDWNLELEKLYWKLRKGEEIKDAKVVFKPIKGQYGYNDNGRPIYDKTLFIPLIPEIIKGSKLEKLNNYMKANKLGYMIFDSGYKVPLDQDTTTFDELVAHIDNVEDSKVPYSEVIDYSGMGIQVLMGNTKENKGTFPTQVNGIQTLDQAVNALIKREDTQSNKESLNLVLN
ncbi:MAG: hypothetical protein HC917_21405 [Richelia sp. SM2_1_7]|nr:hypothetical protein [Richelia sp. SM2_1_7]